MTIIALVTLGIGYVQAQTRKICGLIILIDQPAPTNAPQRQRDIANQIHAYRESIHCKESK